MPCPSPVMPRNCLPSLSPSVCLNRYRRSYDSDFTAPLVFYHVWPALMENDAVIMKGEAVTKRGPFVRWPCIVTIHPKCLIHKSENIYIPRDSIQVVCKELSDKIPSKERKGAAGKEQIFFFDSFMILYNFLAIIFFLVALLIYKMELVIFTSSLLKILCYYKHRAL